ncbi:putative vacuolar segregation protein [Halenospora varia]|nr:putative vacuolar segregation protein [Halenospora varia]
MLSTIFVSVVLGLLQVANGINLTVSSSGGKVVSPIMYGFMFEDINYSGDGGLYAELINNRAVRNLDAWKAIGSVTLTADTSNAVSTAITTSLKVDVPAGATGKVGFRNTGYYGIAVEPKVYSISFYAKGPYTGSYTVDLRSNSGSVLGSKDIPSSTGADWKQYNTTLFPSRSASNADNSFAVTFDAASVAGKSLHFTLVSVFPPTFKNRENGLRVDIANALDEVGGTFLRFPGGNNLEGSNVAASRWQWNKTLGPSSARPGRQGTWGYWNTDGLGIIEYMNWCTDMGLEPLLAVWGGLGLDGTITSQANLQQYVTEALDLLEFLMGSTSSTYGAMRASLGYPRPWQVNYVEVGNEDNLNNGMASYTSYRYKAFAAAISAKYPKMNIIASAPGFDINAQSNGMGWADYHNYDRPDHLVSLFHTFDKVDRKIPIIVGEYAVIQPNQGTLNSGVNWDLPRQKYPTLIGAVAEAVYMLGGEQNADVVKAMCFAPLLQHFNGTQWSPDLIGYTSYPADTTRSMSYYVQKLFANNVGEMTLPVSGLKQGPIYYSAMQRGSQTIVKMANYNGTSTNVSISIPGGGNKLASLTTFTGPSGLSYNLPGKEVSSVVTTPIIGENGVFNVHINNLMVAVLVVGASSVLEPPNGPRGS